MWRCVTYGNKATSWCVAFNDAATIANRLWGAGMWTWEFRP